GMRNSLFLNTGVTGRPCQLTSRPAGPYDFMQFRRPCRRGPAQQERLFPWRLPRADVAPPFSRRKKEDGKGRSVRLQLAGSRIHPGFLILEPLVEKQPRGERSALPPPPAAEKN